MKNARVFYKERIIRAGNARTALLRRGKHSFSRIINTILHCDYFYKDMEITWAFKINLLDLCVKMNILVIAKQEQRWRIIRFFADIWSVSINFTA